jgi:hypothetical protein
MPDMVYVDSSNLDQVGYDDSQMELHVIFKDGAHYVYDGVPQQIYDGLLIASSKGSFLNREVKNTYSYRRV